MSDLLPIAVLASGGGTTLQNLIDRIAAGRLQAEIRVVVADRNDVRALERAEQAGVPARVHPWRKDPEWDRELEQLIETAGVDLVCMAGFLRLWRFSSRLEHRVMNIHPSLLPAFGGRGCYGDRVHRAVLKKGVKLSGCTVHFCDHRYDRGPIIVQRHCPVTFEDTVDTLRSRVFELECQAYPEAIQLFAQRRLMVRDGRVLIADEGGRFRLPLSEGV